MDALTLGTDLFLNQSIFDSYSNYYNQLEELISACFFQPHFKFVLDGQGFGSCPVISEFSSQINSSYEWKHLEPKQTIIFINKHASVLCDHKVEWIKKTPLLFYIAESESCHVDKDITRLVLSSRTYHTMLRLQNNYGILFNEYSVTVGTDQFDVPKFYLSSADYQKKFLEVTGNHLLVHKAKVSEWDMEMKKKDGCQELCDGESPQNISDINLTQRGFSVYATKLLPALSFNQWPDPAWDWLNRKRNWPRKEIVDKVRSRGCLLVPFTAFGTKSPSVYWQYKFTESRKLLYQTLDTKQLQIYHIYSGLLHDVLQPDPLCIDIDILQDVFFWYLEEQENQNTIDVIQFIKSLIEKLDRLLGLEHVPHYFIPEVNHISRIPSSVLQQWKSKLQHLVKSVVEVILDSPYLPFKALRSVTTQEGSKPETFIKRVKGNYFAVMEHHIVSSFDANAKFLVIELFQKLCQGSIDRSIHTHREILGAYSSNNLTNSLALGIEKLLRNNLGVLFHTKALVSFTKEHRLGLFKKAEELLEDTKSIDLCLGRIRLVQLYVARQRYDEGITLALQILQALKNENEKKRKVLSIDEHSGNGDLIQVVSKEKISRTWTTKQYTFAPMYSHFLQLSVPKEFRGTTSIAYCQLLGYIRHPVAVFDPLLYTTLVLVICYARAGMHEKAFDYLEEAEKYCNSMSFLGLDDSEKPTVTFLNHIAQCYLSNEDTERAMKFFKKSTKLLPNPRNPARMNLFWLTVGIKWKKLKEQLSLIGLTALLAISFEYVEAQI